jgi:AraC-like DNA-binding protein
LAEIAAAIDRALALRHEHGLSGTTTPRELASGPGWRVADVVCTCGPADRVVEEQHRAYAIAVVVAGTFRLRSPAGRALMTPGSIMLGNPGECFECSHAHGAGDRCVCVWFEPAHLERCVGGAGVRSSGARFGVPAIPASRTTAPVAARAAAGVLRSGGYAWDEFAVDLANRVASLQMRCGSVPATRDGAVQRRIVEAVRRIEEDPDESLTLDALAALSGLSPFHFLRTFRAATGLSPHQYVLRARLRRAATGLVLGRSRIADIAFECGFGDVSNFNRAFRREFGVSPRRYRESQ